jgi:hypothetical protein
MDNSTLLRATSLVGLSSSLCLSATYFGSTAVALPLLYGLGVNNSSKGFNLLYNNGLRVVAPLAAIAAVSYGTAAYLDPSKRTGYAIAAVASFASIPFTIVFMSTVINRVIEISKDVRLQEKVTVPEVEAMLTQWGRMNLARAGMAGVGGIIGLLLATDSA